MSDIYFSIYFRGIYPLFLFFKMEDEDSEYRTVKDVFKELGKAYTELGKLLYELQKMVDKNNA